MTAPVDKAYVEILPMFRNMNAELKKGVEDSLRGVQQKLRQVSDDTNKMVARSSSGALSRISAVAVAAGNLASQGVLQLAAMGKNAVVAGIQTAAGMEQAQIAFTSLLHSGKAAQKFLGDLETFAAKTPFEMPGLVDAARQLVGVGVKAKDVIPILTAYGDATGALGISQDGFNRIMLATTQAMSAGTLHAGDLLQMTEAGLPIWKLLSEALHKPVSVLKDMSSAGKLMTADVLPKLQKQMEKDYGGSMAKQSQTLTGLWSTMMDTFHIGMARALLPMEPLLRTLIPKAADVMGKALSALATGAAQFFNGLSGHVKHMADSDRPKLELLGTGIRGLFQGFKSGEAASTGFAGVMGRIGIALKQGIEWVKRMGAQLSGPLHIAFTSIIAVVRAYLPDLIHLAMNFTQVAIQLTQKLAPGLKLVSNFLVQHKTVVKDTAIAVGILVAATKAHQAALAVDAAGGIVKWIAQTRVAISVQKAWAAALWLASAPQKAMAAVMTAMNSLFITRIRVMAIDLAAWVRQTAAVVANTAATVAAKVAQTAISVATKLWAAAQWLLNVAMDANPIGLIVVAIAALVAGIIYAYKHSEKFREIVQAVGKALKEAAIAVGHFFQAVWDVSKKVFAWIIDIPNKINGFVKGAANWLVDTGRKLLMGFLNGITSRWHDVTSWFAKMLNRIGSAIGNANTWMKNKAVDFIQNFLLGTKIIWHVVTDWFHGMLSRIGSAIGDANSWMMRKAIAFITNFATGARVAWHIVTDWFHGMLSRIGTAIGNAVNWASSIGKSIINGILSGLKSAWNTVVGWFHNIPGWIKSALGIKSPPAWAVDAGQWIMKALVKGLIGGSFSFTKFIAHFAQLARTRIASIAGNVAKSVGSLINWITIAEKLTGTPASWTSPLLTLISRESGGNPRAINLTDINAKRGDPSRGLMQTIGATFSHYHQPGTSWDIYDPVANIAAGINYIKSRYGTIFNVQQANPNLPPKGYRFGGLITEPIFGIGASGRQYTFGEGGATERVTPNGEAFRMHPNDIRDLAEAIGYVLGRVLPAVLPRTRSVGIDNSIGTLANINARNPF